MKTGRSITELAQELHRRRPEQLGGMSRDVLVATRAMSMNPDTVDKFWIGKNGDAFESTGLPVFENQVMEYCGIPSAYYQRMKNDARLLLANNVNHWLQTGTDTRLIRLFNNPAAGFQARAFLSNKYRAMDDYDLANVALPILHDAGADVVSCEVTDKRLYIKAQFPKIEREIRKGDVIRSGILIQNSEVGHGRLKVQPYTVRLVCLNGMVHTDFGVKKNHVGRRFELDEEDVEQFVTDETRELEDKALWRKVGDVIRGVAQDAKFIDLIAGRMREAAGEALPKDIPETVVTLQKRYRLNETEKDDVLTHLIKGGDLSTYGLAQAVTRTAEDVESYDRATDLERIGWQVMQDRWKLKTNNPSKGERHRALSHQRQPEGD